ncbi:Hypothetical protein D9617_5g067730 [Elsinoe fawcettii]|nr:Hypothetical protein D9617_5g067730 [Elsinoe fawcettii]
MASRNAYLDYKRDSHQLIHWMIHVSNAISRRLSSSDEQIGTFDSSGRLKISEIVPLSRKIVKYDKKIPTTILSLLQKIIDAGTQFYDFFRQSAARTTDLEMQRKNDSHAHVIEVLTIAFETLGGDKWTTGQQATNLPEPDEHSLVNYFSSLNLEESAVEVDEGEDSTTRSISSSATAAKRRGKTKRAKKHERSRNRYYTAQQELRRIRFEDYCFDLTEAESAVEFMWAGHTLFREAMQLRTTVEKIWSSVNSDDTEFAVAAAVSNVAVAMVKRIESALLGDFPGHDSFHELFAAYTNNGQDTTIHGTKVRNADVVDRAPSGNDMKFIDVDLCEWFGEHVYGALTEFAVDYDKNKTGKPTRRMAAVLDKWDPQADLFDMTDSERIAWRKSYIIN